jgi:hypothetical protein
MFDNNQNILVMLDGQIKWSTNPNFMDIQASWWVMVKDEMSMHWMKLLVNGFFYMPIKLIVCFSF